MAFKCLQFGFVIFWQKDLGAKAAHKMLVKLTPGRLLQSNFILNCLCSKCYINFMRRNHLKSATSPSKMKLDLMCFNSGNIFWRHDIQHNGTRLKGLICNTKHT
jgi:hypothetical protein